MLMTCSHCGRNLDDVSEGDACPQCGSLRRNMMVEAQPVVAVAMALPVSVSIGYTMEPGWGNQWRSVERHLARLREQYRGIGTVGNLDVEETVHALFLGLYHLWDWLHSDTATPLTKGDVLAFVNQHPDSLGLCRDYANTRKHMSRSRGRRIAQIISIDIATGYSVKIGYWFPERSDAIAEVDALALAELSERDWRDLLEERGIPLPA